MSFLSKVTNPENTTQFKLLKVSSSNRVNDLLIHNTIPVTSYNTLLTLRYTNKQFELKKDLLKLRTNKNYNVNLASLSDEKLTYDFAKELHFEVRAQGNKYTWDRLLIKLFKSPCLMVSDSVVSKTIFLPSDSDELYDKLKLLPVEEHAGKNSNLIDQENVAIVDKLLEYNCISKKQHKQLLFKCNLLHNQV